MTAQELLDEYFESDVVKAAIASVAIHGFTLGPMGAGTGYTLIHNWMNRGGLANVNVGKAGEITQALANAVKPFGGEIRTEAEVTKYQSGKPNCEGRRSRQRRRDFCESNSLLRRPEAHLAQTRRRTGFAARIRLAHPVHQNARIGGEGASA